MAGKFINTSTAYTEMVKNAAETMKGLLDNPYYLYSDKKASVCTYYNLNTTMTTLDEATRGNYSEISNNSPLRFNKINNFMIYGVTRIEPNLDVGEFGLESSDIVGECIILPKTIIPYPGDYFYLSQLEKPYLFKVTAVNPNTLDTGATLYRINYALVSSDGLKNIEPQVVKEFEFNLDTSGNGTNLETSLIEESEYKTLSALQDAAQDLKDYYISMFYDPKVQTFTYAYGLTEEWHSNNGDPHVIHLVNMQKVDCNPMGFRVYDPFLIEFIIRNKILSGSSTYIYVTQQMFLDSMFAMDYDKTIFASLEDKDINKHYGRSVGNLLAIKDYDQKLSLLTAFPTQYYYMQYKNLNAKFYYIDIFDDPDFKNKILNAEYTDHELKNLIVKYFNNVDITKDDIEKLKHIDYMSNKEFYYGIPFAIFCIEAQIAKQLSSSTSK